MVQMVLLVLLDNLVKRAKLVPLDLRATKE
jgi:hypothetical protein